MKKDESQNMTILLIMHFDVPITFNLIRLHHIIQACTSRYLYMLLMEMSAIVK